MIKLKQTHEKEIGLFSTTVEHMAYQKRQSVNYLKKESQAGQHPPETACPL